MHQENEHLTVAVTARPQTSVSFSFCLRAVPLEDSRFTLGHCRVGLWGGQWTARLTMPPLLQLVMQYLYYGGPESLLIKNNEIMEVRGWACPDPMVEL